MSDIGRNGFKVGDPIMLGLGTGFEGHVSVVESIATTGHEVVSEAEAERVLGYKYSTYWGALSLVRPGSLGSLGPSNDDIPEDEMELAESIGAPGATEVCMAMNDAPCYAPLGERCRLGCWDILWSAKTDGGAKYKQEGVDC